MAKTQQQLAGAASAHGVIMAAVWQHRALSLFIAQWLMSAK